VIADNRQAWLTTEGEQPLFSGLIAGSMAELLFRDTDQREAILAWRNSWQPIEIKRLQTGQDDRELLLDDIAPGVYILMIRSGDDWIPKKFVRI
jgi:hypothetical protein